ncbi:MAG: transglutaminase family protein [Aeromonadaceae bacterium]
MKLTIAHHTHYAYQDEVSRSTQYLRLTPQHSKRQRIHSWELDLPEGATCTTDSFGNVLHVLTLDRPHMALHIQARGVVEIMEEEEEATQLISPLVFLRHSALTQPDTAIRAFAAAYQREEAQLAALPLMMAALLERMPYRPGSTNVNCNAAQAFAAGEGVCQDHTHVFLACCRTLGLPARYVSGYLYTPDTTHVATHAWAEVWCDNKWHTFDVTNQCTRPTQHLKLAVGIDYLDACPVRGIRYGGGSEAMQAHAAVELLAQEQQQQQQ